MFNFLKRKPEKRASDVISWQAVGAGLQAQISNPTYYESLSAVSACVDLISSSLGSCPAYVYMHDYDSKHEDEGNPLAKLIAEGVNRYQTWHCFIEFLMRQVLLRGNAIAHVVYDSTGRLTELRAYPFEWCTIDILPNGKLRYSVTDCTGLYGNAGSRVIVLQQDMLHIKDAGDLPHLGKSRISRSAQAFNAALATQEFSSSLYQQGVRPSGALCVNSKLDASARDLLKADLKNYYSNTNAGSAMVLENGMQWHPYALNAEDAEVLASRQFSVEEIARLFSVPPPLIGDLRHGTFQNSETAGRWFASFCLASWAHKLECEITRVCLDQRHTLSIDLSGLTRGDHAGRWDSYCKAVDKGILTRNEVRELEGWNPLEKDDTEML